MKQNAIRSLLASGTILAIAGCGGGDQATSPDGTPQYTLSKVSGDNQRVATGGTAPEPLVVRVTGAGDAPAANVAVTWTAGAGASVEPSQTTTLGTGEAQVTLHMPQTAGSVTVTAAISGGATQAFQATAAAPAAIEIVSGGDQSGAPGSTLPDPVVALVSDASGAPLGGAMVQFVTGGEGQFLDGTSVDPQGGYISNILGRTTGADGRASAQYVLGANLGIYAAAARLANGPETVLAPLQLRAAGTHQAFVATLAVGERPQGVAVDPVTNTVFVGNNGTFFGCTDLASGTSTVSSTVSVIDGATNQVTTVAAGGTSPIYAVPNPDTRKVYVAATGLTVLDGATLQQLARIPEAGSHQPAINRARNEIWTNTRHGADATWALSLVDGETDELLAFVNLPGGVHGVAVSSARNEVYASRVDVSGLFVIDGATRQLAQTVALPHTLAIAFNARTDRIYVSSGNWGDVYVLDGAAKSLVTTIKVDAHTIEMAVDEGRNRIYAASQSNPYSILVIDGATNTVQGKVPVGPCPFGVAYNPTNDRIYVSNGHDDTVTVLDASEIS